MLIGGGGRMMTSPARSRQQRDETSLPRDENGSPLPRCVRSGRCCPCDTARTAARTRARARLPDPPQQTRLNLLLLLLLLLLRLASLHPRTPSPSPSPSSPWKSPLRLVVCRQADRRHAMPCPNQTETAAVAGRSTAVTDNVDEKSGCSHMYHTGAPSHLTPSWHLLCSPNFGCTVLPVPACGTA